MIIGELSGLIDHGSSNGHADTIKLLDILRLEILIDSRFGSFELVAINALHFGKMIFAIGCQSKAGVGATYVCDKNMGHRVFQLYVLVGLSHEYLGNHDSFILIKLQESSVNYAESI